MDGAPFTAKTSVKGEQKVSVGVPKVGKTDVLLISFEYELADPTDHLEVAACIAGRTNRYIYPYRAEAQQVAVPLRPAKEDEVAIAVRSAGGASLGDGRITRLDMQGFANAAYNPVGSGRAVQNAAVPRVLIPNVWGLIGDPRRDQMAFGYSLPKGDSEPPPGAPRSAETRPATYVDGRIDYGTPLYPSIYPLNKPWDPPLTLKNLRSAQIVIDYEKPRTISGIGIWEQPGDRPVSAFALEACDKYEPDGMTKELKGNWQLVYAGSGNIDYYHAHMFKPLKARVWRYTLLRTPAPVQQIAELELYEDAMDSVMDVMDAQGGGELDGME